MDFSEPFGKVLIHAIGLLLEHRKLVLYGVLESLILVGEGDHGLLKGV